MDTINTAKVLAGHAIQIAKELGAPAIIASGDIDLENIESDIPIYYVTRRQKSIIDNLISDNPDESEHLKKIIDPINRETSGNVQYIEEAAAIEHIIGELREGTIVGVIHTKESSAIVIHEISQSPLIRTLQECEERIEPEVMRAALTIAFDIAASGREGHKIGTAFILGDTEEVMQRSHQMILNPYAGHKDEHRDILDRKNWESVKEFALLDGIFVISETGIVNAAGRYLDVDAKDIDIEKGLGGRHVSAAAITRDTFAIAVTISESGGTVRVYMDGKELLCLDYIERPELRSGNRRY
ncbi:DNA integrity scanning protein DisA nucleotide-binding domain protein [Methanococcoides methylutens]|uniref:DNA integrity scanning protein DisA nucleotide-binding domain protein n=1 Tax=Methanococcoides methylutens TaxID=2226 RepID=UPI004044028A